MKKFMFFTVSWLLFILSLPLLWIIIPVYGFIRREIMVYNYFTNYYYNKWINGDEEKNKIEEIK